MGRINVGEFKAETSFEEAPEAIRNIHEAKTTHFKNMLIQPVGDYMRAFGEKIKSVVSMPEALKATAASVVMMGVIAANAQPVKAFDDADLKIDDRRIQEIAETAKTPYEAIQMVTMDFIDKYNQAVEKDKEKDKAGEKLVAKAPRQKMR